MSEVAVAAVNALVASGEIPPEHRGLAEVRLEQEMVRRTHHIVSSLARLAVGAAALTIQATALSAT